LFCDGVFHAPLPYFLSIGACGSETNRAVPILLLAENKLLLEKELVKSQYEVNTMSKMKNVGKLCRFIVSKEREGRKWRGERRERRG
jgi:hypothetical protein